MENFIVGLTGAFGSGCTFLADKFFVNRYKYRKYTLSEILKQEFNAEYGRAHKDRSELQEFGNKKRKENGAEYFAKKAYERIQKDGLSPNDNVVIDSIRNPAEIRYLRELCPRFYLVAVFADHEIRWERVKETYENKFDVFNKDELKDKGSSEPEYGQKVSNCFFESDLVLSNNEDINTEQINDAFTSMDGKLMHYLNAFMKPKTSHPLITESLMAIAYTNGRRSKCLKRKVGAIVVDEYNNILSSGFNDVPREFSDCKGKYGECYRDKLKSNLEKEIASVLGNCKINIDEDSLKNKAGLAESAMEVVKECFSIDLSSVPKEIIKKIKLLELCRSLHAEENAILNLVHSSSRTDFADCALYATTYPCNLCANKIVQTGIKNVIYFEPYPVEQAKKIFKDGGVAAIPFEGVTFRAFFKAFEFSAD